MRSKLLLLILVSLSATAQDAATDILTSILSQSPLDYIQTESERSQHSGEVQRPSSKTSPLDFIQTESPLDYIQTQSPLDYIQTQPNRNQHSGAPSGQAAKAWQAKARFPRPTNLLSATLPVYGRVSSRFGFRPSFNRMHKGIDIAIPVGDTVRTPAGATVTKISYEANGYGRYIILTHPDGLETRYAHLSSCLVTVGEVLTAGQPIALSGNTGNSTGPHLHFETRYFGNPVDPATLFPFYGGTNEGLLAPNRGTIGGLHSPNGGTNGESPVIAALNTVLRPTAEVPSVAEPSHPARRTYIVRQGDTLRGIAKKHGVSLLRLCELNMLTEATPLQLGQMLRLH